MDRADGAKTANVPNYVTESAYTEDLSARGKVGDVQDGRRLAVVTNDLPYRFSPFSLSVCEFELPQGTLVQRCDYQGPLRHQCHDCMLHLGSTVMAVNGSG